MMRYNYCLLLCSCCPSAGCITAALGKILFKIMQKKSMPGLKYCPNSRNGYKATAIDQRLVVNCITKIRTDTGTKSKRKKNVFLIALNSISTRIAQVCMNLNKMHVINDSVFFFSLLALRCESDQINENGLCLCV